MNLRTSSAGRLWTVVTACLALAVLLALPARAQEVWRFDQTASLGGHSTKVLGAPKVIDTEIGKAVTFNGVDDALFVGVHPLAGAATWTWEMIFKPDPDGKPEQRIFHLQSVDPATGADFPNERMLFEIRIVKGQWCLDSFATAGGQSRTLLDCGKLHLRPVVSRHRSLRWQEAAQLRRRRTAGRRRTESPAGTPRPCLGRHAHRSPRLLQRSDVRGPLHAQGAGRGGFPEAPICSIACHTAAAHRSGCGLEFVPASVYPPGYQFLHNLPNKTLIDC